MTKTKRAYLIDFDNTLFDTEGLKKSISQKIVQKLGSRNLSLFWKIYKKSADKLGYVDIKTISNDLSEKFDSVTPQEFQNLFLNLNFRKFVFSYSLEMIKNLKRNGRVILYSLGDSHYQPVKIDKSGIAKLIGSKNIYVLKDKKNNIDSAIIKLKSQGYDQIIIVDDRADLLEKAKEINPKCITVWLRYGKYKNIFPKDKSCVDFETELFEDLQHYLINIVDKLPQNILKENISIVKDISKDQIKQLIKLTKKDVKVKEFTHDRKRFSSIRTFNTWKKRGKQIYCLIGRKNRLLGIIWFGKKNLPSHLTGQIKIQKISYTFAIRLYRPARGKGISAKFMHLVFNDFRVSKSSGVWLETLKNNYPANELYTNYGFRKIKTPSKDRFLYIYAG